MAFTSYSEDQAVKSSSCYLSSLDDEADSQEQTTLLILDKLESPTLSHLHRKRKTKSNPPQSKKGVWVCLPWIQRVSPLVRE